ncbi:flexible cuticle protein 12-like [Leptopilina heterotoma]|uniref:flexible cuticle protein 12-like n=1 Tax=Leptopilina heterotoma TaxID=63436 RepID=UPI001CA9185D|nr:flexible cuticle protein 12-like [Leptopilina heterotoma]
MKMIFVFAAILALAAAAPQGQRQQDVVVVKELLHNNIGLEGYQYNYELSDGQQREESAELRNAGTENEAIVVRGFYSWVDANGQQHRIDYTADENGFHPVGSDIPV